MASKSSRQIVATVLAQLGVRGNVEEVEGAMVNVDTLLATVRAEEREAALRDAILLIDTAPLCHCAGKQYIDPVALVQRMNAALEAATEK